MSLPDPAQSEAKFVPGAEPIHIVDVQYNVTVALQKTEASARAQVAASSGLQFVYYRVYHKDGAIATKRPAYLNDIYLGRIKSKWVSPPHTAGSLKRCLSSMENIDPTKTKLFASVSSQSALADEAPISLKSNQTLGIIPQAPIILFSETMPEDRMQPGTEGLRVAPDSESPPAPRFLFYGVYSDAGVRASKAPIDAEEPWVSKIDLDSIPPPVILTSTGTSLLHILSKKEDIRTLSQLFTQGGLTPLCDSQIFTEDGNWLGASAEEHLVLKFASRPPFAEGCRYMIQNCCTGNSMTLYPRHSKVAVFRPGFYDGSWKHFTLELRDGGVAFRCVWSERWIGPGLRASGRKHNLYFIPSTTNTEIFFICEDSVSLKAFYDPYESYNPYYLQLRDLDITEARQMWRLIPWHDNGASPRPSFAEGSQYRIQNCFTSNSLTIGSYYSANVDLYLPGYKFEDRKNFTLKRRDDGSVAFLSESRGLWIGPNCCYSETEHGFYFIPSTTYKDFFFICNLEAQAFYDPARPGESRWYSSESKALDLTDTRQQWRLVPV